MAELVKRDGETIPAGHRKPYYMSEQVFEWDKTAGNRSASKPSPISRPARPPADHSRQLSAAHGRSKAGNLIVAHGPLFDGEPHPIISRLRAFGVM